MEYCFIFVVNGEIEILYCWTVNCTSVNLTVCRVVYMYVCMYGYVSPIVTFVIGLDVISRNA